jgi:hypothetical protein
MNSAIELHDSDVEAIERRDSDGSVVVSFHPAYLHKSEGRPGSDSGSGWVQPAHFVIRNGNIQGALPDFEEDSYLSSGRVELGSEIHRNVVPLPLDYDGVVRVHLLFILGEEVNISGDGLKVLLLGEPRYVEEYRGGSGPGGFGGSGA